VHLGELTEEVYIASVQTEDANRGYKRGGCKRRIQTGWMQTEDTNGVDTNGVDANGGCKRRMQTEDTNGRCKRTMQTEDANGGKDANCPRCSSPSDRPLTRRIFFA